MKGPFWRQVQWKTSVLHSDMVLKKEPVPQTHNAPTGNGNSSSLWITMATKN
jgi:hypothetical protein